MSAMYVSDNGVDNGVDFRGDNGWISQARIHISTSMPATTIIPEKPPLSHMPAQETSIYFGLLKPTS